MASKWRQVSLGEVSDLLVGYPFKSALYSENPSSPHLLRGDNIGQGTLRWDNAKRWDLPNGDAVSLQRYWLSEGDVVLAMDRPWIEAGLKYARVRATDRPSLLVQRVARLRGTSACDGRYLVFVVGSTAFSQFVQQVQTGTAVPHISASQVQSFRFLLPSLPEQRAIAHILGTLDDKIDLNRQMSATLEAMARALFESWFVRFDPVRAKAEGRDTQLPADIAALFPDSFEMSEIGEVPKGWVGSYGQIAAERSERVGNANVTVMSAVASSELVRSDDHFTKRVYSKDLSKYKRVYPEDFAYNPSRINIGSVGLHTGDGLGAVSPVYVVVTPRQEWHWFLQLHLTLAQTKEQILTLSSGSVRQSLDCSSFMSIPCVQPSDRVVAAFNGLTSSYRAKVASVVDESQTLTALRDTLLPRLISGDLRVPDAERFLVDAGV